MSHYTGSHKILVGIVASAVLAGKKSLTYLVIRVVELEIVLIHCLGNNFERLNNVAKDDGLPFQLLVFAEALRINKLHLLENS